MEKILSIMTVLMLISWLMTVVFYKQLKSLRDFIKELMSVSNKVRDKNFEIRLKKYENTVLARFSNNFNSMIGMLEQSFEDVQKKNIQLNSIIKSVSNGVLVVDIENKVFLMNELAKDIFKCPYDGIVEGYLLTDVLKERTLREFIMSNINIDRYICKELKTPAGSIYNIKIEPLKIQGRKEIMVLYVINIEDITQRVKLENMRRDFAANVSHELKTPLTSIQGFVETLKVNDDSIDSETRKRFLDIIENESDRLRILINDILLLSSIEGDEDVLKEWTDIRMINDLVFDLLEKKAAKYGIDMKVTYLCKCDKIYTHKQYYKELLINLITNGIKYNRKGGYVHVTYRDDEYNFYIDIKDNGIGIADDEKERIFERFYRVSKSRNKDVEGTGLGLAITKHIVLTLGGSIGLESELGKGSTFKVMLPKK